MDECISQNISSFFCSPKHSEEELKKIKGIQCYNFFSNEIQEYVISELGDRTMKLSFMIIIYTFILITGTIGSISTCVVILTNACMRTRTSCYLFSLAVSDLILLFNGIPDELGIFSSQEFYPWKKGLFLCKLKNCVAEFCSLFGVVILTCFTVERYMVICNPFGKCSFKRFHNMLQHRRLSYPTNLSSCIRMIVVCSIAMSIYVLPIFFLTGTVTLKLSRSIELPENECGQNKLLWNLDAPIPASTICTSDSSSWLAQYINIDHLLLVTSIIFFVLPMLIMIVLYCLIDIEIRKHNTLLYNAIYKKSSTSSISLSGYPERKKFIETFNPNEGYKNNRRTVTKMLLSMVIAFLICWAPLHLQRIMTSFRIKESISNRNSRYAVLYLISGSLHFFTPTINPILYSLMSAKFRKCFKATLYCKNNTKVEKNHGSSTHRVKRV